MSAASPTRVRHTILGLVVLVYFITYLDRVLLSNALPVIQKEFGFDLVTLGLIQSCYQWAYALFQIPGGWFGDRAGPRIAMASVVVWWSVFTFITGFSISVTMLMVCLFLIGMGEAGAFPIANRALSRWMLPSERGFAQGATHAGSRLAGALTPVLVATLIAAYSWHVPFFLFARGRHRLGGGVVLVLSRRAQRACRASMPASATRSSPRWAMPRGARRSRGS